MSNSRPVGHIRPVVQLYLALDKISYVHHIWPADIKDAHRWRYKSQHALQQRACLDWEAHLHIPPTLLSIRGQKSFEHGTVPYHTEVCWLSGAQVLHRFFESHEEICQCLKSRGVVTTVLRDEKLQCDLAFLCDIAKHITALNLQLQGRGHVITDMYDAVRAFQSKLRLWETRMQQGNFSHFPQLKSVYMLLKCSACLEANTYVSSFCLWWRWTKTNKGTVSLIHLHSILRVSTAQNTKH